MGNLRSNSFGGRSSKANFERVRRTVSEGSVQIGRLKAEVLNQKNRLEERFKRVSDQISDLKEVKIEEMKAFIKQQVKVVDDMHEGIDKRIEDIIIQNVSSKKERESLLQLKASGENNDREAILKEIGDIKKNKGEDLEEFERQERVIRELMAEEANSIKGVVDFIQDTAGILQDKEDYDNSGKDNSTREKIIDTIRAKSVYSYNDIEKKMSLLGVLTNMEVDNRESIFKTMLNQNGARLRKEELKLVKNIYESSNSEYRIAAINSLITVKEKEAKYNEDYINQYKKLYSDVEEEITRSDIGVKAKYLSNRFEAIRLCEENLRDISVEEKEFYEMCRRNKIGPNRDLENNNFTRLYKEAKASDNRYVKLFFDIAKYGKEREEEFERYLSGHKMDILKELKDCAEYIRKNEKMDEVKISRIDRLEDVLATIGHAQEINIEDLKMATSIAEEAKSKMLKASEEKFDKGFWNGDKEYLNRNKEKILQNIKGYAERIDGIYKLKSDKLSKLKRKLVDIEHLQEVDSKKLGEVVDLFKGVRNEIIGGYNYKHLQKINNKQKQLGMVQVYTDEIVRNIGVIIAENKSTIEMKIYHEGLLKQELFKNMEVNKEKDFVYSDDKIKDTVIKELGMTNNVKRKKLLKNRFRKITGVAKMARAFLELRRKGDLNTNTLILKRKLTKIQNEKKRTSKILNSTRKKVKLEEVKRRESLGHKMDRE